LENNDLIREGRLDKSNFIFNKADFKQPENAAGMQVLNDN
jgi:hypothetical protein